VGPDNKKVDVGIGIIMTIFVAFAIALVALFVAIPIVLTYGTVYVFSQFSLVEFHYYQDFWSNVWYFIGFAMLHILMLIVSEIVIFIDKDKSKVKSIDDIGPQSMIEWVKYLIIFIVYMNVFNLYSERLDTSIIGASLIAITTVFGFYLFGLVIDKIDDAQNKKERMEEA
jgi:hypothetical protein